MEAVARQFATGKKCLVIRNGWFSYRWTQIFDMGGIPAEATVLKARRIGAGKQAPFAPRADRRSRRRHRARSAPTSCSRRTSRRRPASSCPTTTCAPWRDAVHAVGGLFVLDCIASGAIWVDMAATGVDVLISAPQKGWSGSPCCALVMLSERARAAIDATTSTSFACDLRKWLRSWKPTRRAATPTTRRCRPTR